MGHARGLCLSRANRFGQKGHATIMQRGALFAQHHLFRLVRGTRASVDALVLWHRHRTLSARKLLNPVGLPMIYLVTLKPHWPGV